MGNLYKIHGFLGLSPATIALLYPYPVPTCKELIGIQTISLKSISSGVNNATGHVIPFLKALDKANKSVRAGF